MVCSADYNMLINEFEKSIEKLEIEIKQYMEI